MPPSRPGGAAGTGYGPDTFAAALSGQVDVSRETLERLTAYETLLRKWQRRINLVSNTTLDDIWRRHFADSAQMAPHLRSGARRIVDLGSGAGFPGLVLKILRPDLDVTLIESDTRKSAFLSTVAAEIDLPVTVIARRIEDVGQAADRPKADVVTARALAPLPKLLDLASAWNDDGPQYLFLKGQNVGSELISAAKCWRMSVQEIVSATHPDARLLSIERLDRVQDRSV